MNSVIMRTFTRDKNLVKKIFNVYIRNNTIALHSYQLSKLKLISLREFRNISQVKLMKWNIIS